MKKSVIIPSIISLAFIIVIALWFSIQCITVTNRQARLMNEFQAQEKKIEAVHDNVWKTISQKAKVTKEYSSKFDEIYKHLMSARYSGKDGVLMNWIKESNPNFDSSMYKELSMSIEIQRKQFLSAQEQIIDVVREHNNLLVTIPSKWFLGGVKKLDYTVISSNRSKDVMNTRVDNDDSVF